MVETFSPMGYPLGWVTKPMEISGQGEEGNWSDWRLEKECKGEKVLNEVIDL